MAFTRNPFYWIEFFFLFFNQLKYIFHIAAVDKMNKSHRHNLSHGCIKIDRMDFIFKKAKTIDLRTCSIFFFKKSKSTYRISADAQFVFEFLLVVTNVVYEDCIFESLELSSVAKLAHLYLLSPLQLTADSSEFIAMAIVVPSFTVIFENNICFILVDIAWKNKIKNCK